MENEKLIRLEGLITHLKTKILNGEERITEDDNFSCSEIVAFLSMAKNHYKLNNKPMPYYVNFV